jgi:hypothetical protein
MNEQRKCDKCGEPVGNQWLRLTWPTGVNQLLCGKCSPLKVTTVACRSAPVIFPIEYIEM